MSLNERIANLKGEFEKGQLELTRVDQRRAEVRDTLLRISGAIQALEELREQAAAPDSDRPVLSAVAAA
jgi:hypothetical protein